MTTWHQTVFSQQAGLEYPIVQGPFGGGLSSVELVTAVSESGGLGSFGVHHLSGPDILATAAAIRARTTRPFALNLWIPLDDREASSLDDAAFAQHVARLRPFFDMLDIPPPARPAQFAPPFAEQIAAVLEARPPVFSFVYGIPSADVLSACRARGILTLGAATTAEEARALELAGVDAIVATGSEAGGHRVSFLRPAEASLTGTLALIPQVVDAVRIPVIAAGGIADGRGIAAALALGAQGVQIGTAFLACAESAASLPHRSALFSPEARHTTLTRVFSGRLARGIHNRFVDALKPFEADVPAYPVQNWLTGHLKRAAIAQNRPELMSLWAGQGAPLLQHRQARPLMQALIEQTEAVLRRVAQ